MKATKFEDKLYESGLSLQKVKVFSGNEEEVLQRVEKRRGSVVMSFSIRGPVKSQGVL